MEQGLNHLPVAEKAEALKKRKNLIELQGAEDRATLEAGAEALKTAARRQLMIPAWCCFTRKALRLHTGREEKCELGMLETCFALRLSVKASMSFGCGLASFLCS